MKKIILDCGIIRSGSKVLFKWDIHGEHKTIRKGEVDNKLDCKENEIWIYAPNDKGELRRYLCNIDDIIKRLKY